MFYCIIKGETLKNNKYNLIKYLKEAYNDSSIENSKREYSLLEFYNNSLKNNKIFFSLFHPNKDVNRFLNGGIKQGNSYSIYGNSLTGKSFFLEILIINNLKEILLNKTKILIITTNGGFTYTKLKKMNTKFNNNNLNINQIIDILPLRTENDVLCYLDTLNRLQDPLYSFIFIDNFNKSCDKINSNLNTLNICIENLKKNKDIGFITVIFKEYNNSIEIKNFQPLISSDKFNFISFFNYQLTFFNNEIDLYISNLIKRKYFLNILDLNSEMVFI